MTRTRKMGGWMKKTGWALIALLAVILIAEAGFRLVNRVNPLFVFHDDGYGRLRGKPFARSRVVSRMGHA